MLSTRTIETECHPQIKKLLWYVFTGTRGGLNRIRIVLALKERPYNANQLANEFGLDYKAIKHHIKVLEKNNIIARDGHKYGTVYLLSTCLEANLDVFEEIITKLDS